MRLVVGLLVLFTVLPALEIALLVVVGGYIGALETFCIIVFTGILGAALAKRQGVEAWQAVNTELQAGRLPAREIAEAFLILVAGILLLTPGFITDVTGFVLLVPVGRRLVLRGLIRYFQKRIQLVSVPPPPGAQPGPAPDSDVIDVEAHSEEVKPRDSLSE